MDEAHNGCKLLLDMGADTGITRKHTWVVEIIERFTANAKGFDDSSQALENLHIINLKYAYDMPGSGETIILEVNHCIYKTDEIKRSNIYVLKKLELCIWLCR